MYSQRMKCIVKEIQWEVTEKALVQGICVSFESLMKRDTEKGLCCHFLTALRASKTQKELHRCLTTLKVFNTEKTTLSLSYDF